MLQVLSPYETGTLETYSVQMSMAQLVKKKSIDW